MNLKFNTKFNFLSLLGKNQKKIMIIFLRTISDLDYLKIKYRICFEVKNLYNF